jgi:hypothetical protein
VAVYSFNMTAGTDGADIRGFFATLFGSIDVEPFPGNQLISLVEDDTLGQIFFAGDLSVFLAGFVVWVDGVAYPFDTTDWTFDAGATVGEWSAGATPQFVDTVVYLVELRGEDSLPPIEFGGQPTSIYRKNKMVIY